jgi:hypothetical protein
VAGDSWRGSAARVCDLLIFVDEAVEAVAPVDLVELDWYAAGEWA